MNISTVHDTQFPHPSVIVVQLQQTTSHHHRHRRHLDTAAKHSLEASHENRPVPIPIRFPNPNHNHIPVVSTSRDSSLANIIGIAGDWWLVLFDYATAEPQKCQEQKKNKKKERKGGKLVKGGG